MNIEEDFYKKIEDFYQTLPHFPDGRIDYRTADVALVVTIFVQYQTKILLLKRSDKVGTYKEKWNAISGYLDEISPLEEKILEELEEEIGVTKKDIFHLSFGEPYTLIDNDIHKQFIVYPALAKLNKKSKIRLDWEHSEYCWIEPKNITQFDLIPDLNIGLERVLRTRKS